MQIIPIWAKLPQFTTDAQSSRQWFFNSSIFPQKPQIPSLLTTSPIDHAGLSITLVSSIFIQSVSQVGPQALETKQVIVGVVVVPQDDVHGGKHQRPEVDGQRRYQHCWGLVGARGYHWHELVWFLLHPSSWHQDLVLSLERLQDRICILRLLVWTFIFAALSLLLQ